MALASSSWSPKWAPHPDVWLVVGLLAALYYIAVVRLGPRYALPGRAAVTRFQATCWGLGVLAVWFSSDFPVHDVAEQALYSVHMVQHLVISLIAAPLLLLGTPAWMLRRLLRPEPVFRAARWLCRFLPALILFNVVVVILHWPMVVNHSVLNALLHFSIHTLVFLAGLVVWMPVLSPLPEIPRLTPLPRMLFLFAQSVLPTVPASFMTFGTRPLYEVYEPLPKLWGLTALDDQLVAGLIMKIGAGALLWLVIAVIFFRWVGEEERRNRNVPRRAWQDLDRQLSSTRTTG